MKTKSVLNIFNSIFLLVGIITLIGSFFVIKSNNDFKKIAEEITGKIVQIESYHNSEGEDKHNVYVSYSYNGTLYDSVELNYYSSSMYEGKEISLLCDPNNPRRIKINSPIDIGGGILLFMGIIFVAVGGISFISGIRKNMQEKQLLKEGIVIHAIVDRIEYNTGYSVNGQHPFVIYCSYKDDYKDVKYLFKSDNLWTDPQHVFPVGSYIDVLVNGNDYSKYHVKAETVIEQKVVDYT